MTIAQLISWYLESNKRLVVPQLGAFIVKVPGQSIVFSELLKREDGILRSLLLQQGRSELEAAGEIDRFVFEVRHAVEQGVGFPLEGLGIMKPGPKETIAFSYAPQTLVSAGTASEIPQPTPKVPIPEFQQAPKSQAQPPQVEKTQEEEAPSEAGTPPQPAKRSRMAALKEAARKWRSSATEARAEYDAETEEEPNALEAKAAEIRTTYADFSKRIARRFPQNEGPKEAEPREQKPERAASGQPRVPKLSPSVKLNPEPYVKGLRYGKPHKNTDVYTYVNGRKRVDRFLLVAVAAAVIAVGVIAYVFFYTSRGEGRGQIITIEQADAARGTDATPQTQTDK